MFESLMYGILVSRPEVAFAVGVFCQVVANTNIQHGEVMKVVVAYLQECMIASREHAKIADIFA